MSPRTPGSAAATHKVAPQSAVKRAVVRTSTRLLHVAELALIAGEHDRPTRGARYLVNVLDEVAADVARLRSHLARSHPDAS